VPGCSRSDRSFSQPQSSTESLTCYFREQMATPNTTFERDQTVQSVSDHAEAHLTEPTTLVVDRNGGPQPRDLWLRLGACREKGKDRRRLRKRRRRRFGLRQSCVV
jgi:hypothetical protein